MFVKMYRYKIKKTNFNNWKKNNEIVTNLNKNYGGKYHRLIKKEKNLFHIVELGFYKSKKEFENINKKFDNDPKTDKLFEEFLSLVHDQKFVEEEFETV